MHACISNETAAVHCTEDMVNALQAVYPTLAADKSQALEPIIRGCFADFQNRWDTYQVIDALHAFMTSKNWL